MSVEVDFSANSFGKSYDLLSAFSDKLKPFFAFSYVEMEDFDPTDVHVDTPTTPPPKRSKLCQNPCFGS